MRRDQCRWQNTLYCVCICLLQHCLGMMYYKRRRFILLVLLTVGSCYVVLFVQVTKPYHSGLRYNNRINNKNISLRDVIAFRENQTLKILLWTDFHRYTSWWPYMMGDSLDKTCGKHSCQFTYNKSELDTADALLFDIFRIRNFTLPEYHLPDQYWVLYTHEWLDYFSTANSMLREGFFNISASYMKDSDIMIKYGECTPRTEDLLASVLNTTAVVQNKFALWLVSDCRTLSRREFYVAELLKHIHVDIFGKCNERIVHHTRTFGEAPRIGEATPHEIASKMSRYKFYLAFEGTLCKEFITEKVFKVMVDNVMSIPVVRGSGPYTGILPPGSYIDANDFISPFELAKFLKSVADNDTLYQSYFDYRRHYKCENYAAREHVWPCSVCEGVIRFKKHKKRKQLGMKELGRFMPNGNCHYEVHKMNDMTLDKRKRQKLREKQHDNVQLLAKMFDKLVLLG